MVSKASFNCVPKKISQLIHLVSKQFIKYIVRSPGDRLWRLPLEVDVVSAGGHLHDLMVDV